jgi:hypothetical protein
MNSKCMVTVTLELAEVKIRKWILSAWCEEMKMGSSRPFVGPPSMDVRRVRWPSRRIYCGD